MSGASIQGLIQLNVDPFKGTHSRLAIYVSAPEVEKHLWVVNEWEDAVR